MKYVFQSYFRKLEMCPKFSFLVKFIFNSTWCSKAKVRADLHIINLIRNIGGINYKIEINIFSI